MHIGINKKIRIIVSLLFMMCMLSACGKEEDKKSEQEKSRQWQVETVDISELPVVTVQGAKELVEEFPGMELETETQGEIISHTICDNKAYYYVAYDTLQKQFYFSQVAIYEQDLQTGEISLMAEKIYDNGGMWVIEINVKDNIPEWFCMDTDYNIYQCSVNQGQITEELYEKPSDFYDFYSFVEPDDYSDGEEWKKDVPREYLSEEAFFVYESDTWLLWNQLPARDNYDTKYLNIKNKINENITQLKISDYGGSVAQKISGDLLIFQTADDIKSYENDTDLYGNVYMVDLNSMDITRITDGYGNTYSTDKLVFDDFSDGNGYLSFVSREYLNKEACYDKLYYIYTE